MLDNHYGPVIAVGALNLDLCGTAKKPLRMHDSNPGSVTLSAGGVAHNIARHLAQADQAVELLTLLGCDAAADMLLSICAAEGIGLRYAQRLLGASSSYLCIHDEKGDLAAAVNDMALLDAYSPDMLLERLPQINAAPLVVTDANLPQETLEMLANAANPPLLLDPVSGFKAPRAKAVIGRFAAIKPNLLEAEILSGEQDPARAAAWFLRQGTQRVFISMGEMGVYYADGEASGLLPATRMRVPSANGAGDAMTAGIALGLLCGLPVWDCAALGVATVTEHLLKQGGTLL